MPVSTDAVPTWRRLCGPRPRSCSASHWNGTGASANGSVTGIGTMFGSWGHGLEVSKRQVRPFRDADLSFRARDIRNALAYLCPLIDEELDRLTVAMPGALRCALKQISFLARLERIWRSQPRSLRNVLLR